MKIAFQISMDYLDAGMEELKTLLSIYNIKYKFLYKFERFIILDIINFSFNNYYLKNLYNILNRSATIKRALVIFLDHVRDFVINDIYSEELHSSVKNFFRIAVHVHLFRPLLIKSSEIENIIKHVASTYLYDFNGKIDLQTPEATIALYNVLDRVWVGIEIYENLKKGFEFRRAKYRPFFSPLSLYPKLARLMVNLTGAKEGDLIIDPFCGAGSISMESSLLSIENICIELMYKWCKGAVINTKWVDSYISCVNVINGDSLTDIIRRNNLKFYIATDPPYGRLTSTGYREVKSIYDNFINNFVLNSVRAVFILPYSLEGLIDKYDLNIYFKTLIPIHRSLTRVLYVIGGV